MIKVISGKYRSRNLFVPDSLLVPTKSIVRESLSNMVREKIKGASCLDLFAGSGAMGIEFLSNEAASCDFVEHSLDCLEAVKKNLESLKERNGKIFPLDSLNFLNQVETSYDIIFIDPPYKEKELYIEALRIIELRNLLKEDGVIILEYEGELPSLNPSYIYLKEHKYGKTKIIMLKKKTA